MAKKICVNMLPKWHLENIVLKEEGTEKTNILEFWI